MYERRSRLTIRQQGRLIEYFVRGSDSACCGRFAGHSAEHGDPFLHRLRKLIAGRLPSYELTGEVEADESYFGGHRKGKRGRGAAGKVAVFGLLKRGGKMLTAVIVNAKAETLIPLIQEKVKPDSIVYTDALRSYNALDVSEFHHLRINHSELFADQRNHINGIENFWNQAKRHLRRYNGIQKENFSWFLKECEWRFNGEGHKHPIKQLKHWYKSSKH